MPRRRKLEPLVQVLAARLVEEDTEDSLVLRLDHLLERIAAVRDEAAAIGGERYLRARWALQQNSTHVVLTQLQDAARVDGRAKVAAPDSAVLTTAGEEIRNAMDALARRRQLAELVDRVNAVLLPPAPAALTTVSAKRERLLELLRFWAGQTRLMAEAEGREIAAVAMEDARDLAAAVDTFWPSVARRLRGHLEKVAAFLVASRPGRPKKGARYAVRAPVLLAELLDALDLGSPDTHRRRRRRARRGAPTTP